MSAQVVITFQCDALVKPELVAEHRTDINGTPRCNASYRWAPMTTRQGSPVVQAKEAAAKFGWGFSAKACLCPEHRLGAAVKLSDVF